MSNYSGLVTYVLFFNDTKLDYFHMQFLICWTRETPLQCVRINNHKKLFIFYSISCLLTVTCG